MNQHQHKWVLLDEYKSKDGKYLREKHYCSECNTYKFVKRFWNKKPTIKLIHQNEIK